MDDYVVADADHPVRVAEEEGEPRPYIMVRDGLEALINRPVFYRLVEAAQQEGDELVVYSRGARFPRSGRPAEGCVDFISRRLHR